jgi:nucleotide-binding universal stress UspA family protein
MQATLILANMIPLTPWQYKKAVAENTRKRLASLVPADVLCRFDYLAYYDFPGEGILRLARDRGVNLIVMGVRKKGAAVWTAHLPWSTASEVVNAAPCPVLTVRA